MSLSVGKETGSFPSPGTSSSFAEISDFERQTTVTIPEKVPFSVRIELIIKEYREKIGSKVFPDSPFSPRSEKKRASSRLYEDGDSSVPLPAGKGRKYSYLIETGITRICPGCNEEKPNTETYFSVPSKRKGPSTCLRCYHLVCTKY